MLTLVAGGGAIAASSFIVARLARRLIGLWLGVTAYTLRVVTLRLYTRCPDCAGRLRYEARVCLRCGHRLLPAPAPRSR